MYRKAGFPPTLFVAGSTSGLGRALGPRADAFVENRQRWLAAGTNDLVAQPHDPESLVATWPKWSSE
jgi:hypothetical protein